MRFSIKPSFSRAMALLGLLGLGAVQTGCAHPVVMEPSVSFSTQIGHAPVYAQVGLPGTVIYGPPRVIYAPPPPPRVIYAPQVYRPAPAWAYGHDRHWGHDRHERGRGERRDDRRDGRRGGHGDRDEWRH